MRIGLFGGSFDPAHEGHAHVAETALKRLGLDRIWWLVTPQNPFKRKSSLLAERVASAQRMTRGRRMVVTDIEAKLGARYTYQTLRALKRLYPGVRFVLVMGEDNLSNFKLWKHWREVAAAVPIAIVSRPGATPSGRMAAPKDWKFLNARYFPQASHLIRAAQRGEVAKPPQK